MGTLGWIRTEFSSHISPFAKSLNPLVVSVMWLSEISQQDACDRLLRPVVRSSGRGHHTHLFTIPGLALSRVENSRNLPYQILGVCGPLSTLLAFRQTEDLVFLVLDQ